MSKVLAPSNIGFVRRDIVVPYRWLPSIAYPWQWVKGTAKVTILSSYKAPTKKSDRKRPTDYSRMINKIVLGGPVKCDNVFGRIAPDRYYYESNQACTIGVISNSMLPFGSSIANGQVEVPSWMVDAVIAQCKQDMNGIAANIYEDLGQAAEPLKLYVDTYRTIILLYLSARAGKWKYVRRELKRLGSNVPRTIGNGWLMYFYGIKPLLSTLDTLVSDQNKRKPGSFSASARREISVPMRSYVTSGPGVQGVASAKVQAQCQLEAEYEIKADLAQYYRLGIAGDPAEPLLAAWALAPWSFVVDWILPVEQFLLSLVWAPFLTYQGGFVGKRHYGNAAYTDFRPWAGGPRYSGQLPRVTHQVRFYQRIAYPYFVPPVNISMRLTLNRNQIISAVALIVTR